VNLTDAIRAANVEVEIAEAAMAASDYSHKHGGDRAASVAAELLDYLFSDSERELIDTRWDVPRVCAVLLPRGRFGEPMTETALRTCVPKRARHLITPAFEAMTREGLARQITIPAAPVRSIAEQNTCDRCGNQHYCKPMTGASPQEQVRMMVLSRLAETGQVPSSRSIARMLGLNDDRSVRAHWDKLARAGDLPSRTTGGAWALPQQPSGEYKLTMAGERLAAEFASPLESLSALDAYAQGSALT
jgi:hypothetical protein